MTLSPETIRSYLEANQLPLRCWLAPEAAARHGDRLAEDLGAPATLVRVSEDAPPDAELSPAVLVLDARDLRGPQRQTLLLLRERALPGRPVICGGQRHRSLLLDAINTWQVRRLVPDPTVPGMLSQAVRQAHRSLNLDHAVERAALDLRRECQRLNRSVDALLDTRGRLLHAERLATVGRITGALSRRVQRQHLLMEQLHSALSRRIDEPALADMLTGALETTSALGTSLDDMQALTDDRDEPFQLELIDLDPLVARAGELFLLDPKLRNRRVTIDCRAHLQVRLDRHRTVHVLMNLLRNALQATGEGDAIALRTRRNGDLALIEVEDGGCGMSEEVQQQLFTPFFTTKGRKGMGLGLRMSRAAVVRQGGTLTFRSRLGEGSCFQITFPRHHAPRL